EGQENVQQVNPDVPAGQHPGLLVVHFPGPHCPADMALSERVMNTMIHNTIHVLLALTLPPLLLGVIGKTKALFAGRVGPPLLQPYYDLIKLSQKGSVFSTTTWMFRAGPVVGLATSALTVLFIPLANGTAPI